MIASVVVYPIEGLSSNRPELVALKECVDDHDGHVDLQYLTDSEASILKLQKRVEAGAATLLLKVKAHRGDPLNEEAEIRAEMGRLKEQNDITRDDPLFIVCCSNTIN